MTDLADLIDRNAAFTPDKTAIRFEHRSLSYATLAARVAAAARALKSQLGVGRGDRVAILSANRPDYLVALYACARLGAMLVPINWRLAVPEQLFILGDADVKLLLVERDLAGVVEPLAKAHGSTRVVELDALDGLLDAGSGDGREHGVDLTCPLLVVYTSGTTGRPKGAVLRQDALVWNAAMSQHMHGLTSDDHILSVLPMFHVGGLNIQTTPALQLGASVSLHARFAPGPALAAIAAERPTHLVLVPAMIEALLQHPAWPESDLSSLRALCTGSTVVPQALIDRVTVRGLAVLQVYGATETCPIAVYTRLGGEMRGTSTGLPGLHCEARIVDEQGREVAHGTAGEIVVRGPSVFTGYWRDPQSTAEALREGWYHTGDIGARDADGYFTVRDRKKNMIISGSENVYPAEIERVLHEHADVKEAAVIGRPDPRWQEVPVAYIVLHQGATPDAAALQAHVAGQLARFKVPRDFIFVADLPRNALGKVQHFRLRASLEGRSAPG
jgi:fatty-acyl-CoA synthase